MKTILISGLVSASNSSVASNQNELGSMLEHMFADIDTDLQTCYDIIPGNDRVGWGSNRVAQIPKRKTDPRCS